MKIFLLTAAAATLLPGRIYAQPISPAQKIAGVPAKYRRAVQFLERLAQEQKRGDGETFSDRKIAFSHIERIASFVSGRGVSIVDVNENNGKPRTLSRAILARDLKRTGSSAFDSFAYAGFIFAQNYAQYSRLTCTPTKNGAVVEMPSGHRFTWVSERGRLQLRKLEYLRVEGD